MRRLFVAALLLASCGGSETLDAGGIDSGGSTFDVGFVDADAGSADAEALDAQGPDAGLGPDGSVDAGASTAVGIISGACGELDDTELLGGAFSFQNAIDFPMGYSMQDALRLSEGAQEILREGTAGGSSGLSEAFSFEVLHRCEGAGLVKTETEIGYEPAGSKKTDILVEIDGLQIGVSVTRAVGFPRDDPYTVMRAQMLLAGKLADVLESSANVVAQDAWSKQILHVIAYGPMHAMSILAAAEMIDPAVRADTILWVTVTDGDDLFLY